MPPRPDWTPGPAKWVVVLILTAAIVAGLGFTLLQQRSPWRSINNTPSNTATASPAHPFISEPGPQPRRDSPKPAPIAAKINVNTASAAELELLPGVGPAIAQRIIEERETGGAFRRVEDLGRVRGIGPRTIEQLRPHVVVD